MLKKYSFWVTILVTSLVVANVVAGKVIQIGSIVLPAAVVSYAFTFLCTDIINEKWGRKKATRAVILGFVGQIFASLLILMAQYLPVAPFATEAQEAYEILLGQNWRFVIASLTAYLIAQNVDVYVFDKIKQITGKDKKWLRNNGSTMFSQLIDTAIFITIGFYGTVPSLLVMIFSQYLIKLILAAIDTPVFYLMTKVVKEE